MRGATAGQENTSKAVISLIYYYYYYFCLHYCNIWVQSRAQACCGFYITIFTIINLFCQLVTHEAAVTHQLASLLAVTSLWFALQLPA